MNLLSTREAFDRHAETYDETFSSLGPTRVVRARIWQIADELFARNARLIDLGCGTGDDSIHFAERGLDVTSIDIAPRMIGRLINKATSAGLSDRITPHIGDLRTFKPGAIPYDGLFSNFGALNCIEDATALRTFAESALRPGSFLLLVTMGRWYFAEAILFLLKGDFRRAFRRLRKNTTVMLEGIEVPMRYHSLRDLRRDLGPLFSLKSVYGLHAVDPVLARLPSMGVCSDHYVSVWQFR